MARSINMKYPCHRGRRMAEAVQAEFKWDTGDEWMRAGARIHTLQGLLTASSRPMV